jgi:hypothetical protein
MKTCDRTNIGVAALCALLLGLSGCGEDRAVIPSSYDGLNAKDGSFKFVYPSGWAMKSGGGNGQAWAECTSGSATISVDSNIAGSLLGDLTQANNQAMGQQNTDPSRAPVAVVHEMEQTDFEGGAGVKEQTPTVVKTGLGDARKSEFTGKPAFGPAIHGCRVTALSLDRRIRVVCRCSETEWAALQPVFDKVIESVAKGSM